MATHKFDDILRILHESYGELF